MELFDYLNNLTEKKKDWDSNNDEMVRGYTPYMINRFISMTDVYLPLVNAINKYDIPKETHYKYFLSTLPQRKQYFKYIKKSKDSKENLEKIARYFEVGLRDAERYIELLSDNQIQIIIDKFKSGKEK